MATAILSPLCRADGSAAYSKNGYSVIAAVNGPIEVQRRDELPDEAAVDVAVRPAAGVGGRYRFGFAIVAVSTDQRHRFKREASRVYYPEYATPCHTCFSTSTHSGPNHATNCYQPGGRFCLWGSPSGCVRRASTLLITVCSNSFSRICRYYQPSCRLRS